MYTQISGEKESLKRQVKELENRISFYENMNKTEYNMHITSMEVILITYYINY